jgi:hypothetical protein
LITLVVTNTALNTDLPQLGMTYRLLDPPTGATITTNGVIYWTPSEAQGPGTNTITTVVTDTGTSPLSATNSIVVVVEEINTAPVLPYQSDRTLAGLQPLTVTNTATDTDIPANTLSYLLIEAPATAAIDTNGVITWTPTAADAPSTNVFTTVVADYNPWATNDQHLGATNRFMVTLLPLPVFHILYAAMSNSIVSVTWEAEVGRSYRLQYKDDLGETNWQDVLPDIVASGSTATATDPLAGGVSRFYRVRLSLP